MRVAVSQFATSLNIQENLATCIRVLNKIAVCRPSLIVLPEFCNTQFCSFRSGYQDHNQAWDQALACDGVFLQTIAEQAKKHECYIVLNVTLRRDLIRDHQDGAVKSSISVTSCIFSPQGKLIQEVGKQALLGLEHNFFTSENELAEAVTTPYGKLGLLSGNDSISFESSRELSLAGAQLLCNPLSSFALDHSDLHSLSRACENNVFLATANKVGLLMPKSQSSQDAVSSMYSSISEDQLIGSGLSQIVSPDGKVLAKIANNEEDFVFADIDLAEFGEGKLVGIHNKLRPDGTPLIKQLRPELYLSKEQSLQHKQDLNVNRKVPVTANVAIFATFKTNEQAIEDVCFYIENNLSDVIQLPELFFVADKSLTHNAAQLESIAELSRQFIEEVSAVLRPFQYVCTSLIIEGRHQAVLINEHGLLAKQAQLHFCKRYQWTPLGNDLNIVELPLEQGKINIAMLTADDANVAEIVKVATANSIHLLLVPFDIQEPSEVEVSLLSRAAENRICIVAATREKSFVDKVSNDTDGRSNTNKIKSKKSTGLIANLTPDFGLLPQWKPGKFTGYINRPIVKHQYGKITKALVYPIAACSKSLD